ncbi:MAG: hypothetical protein ACYCYI_10280 [Saccharofermentanales bacterium]
MSYEFARRKSSKRISISIIIIIIILSLSFICGCSSKEVTNYRYTGENSDWKAEYKGSSTLEFYEEKGILKCKDEGDGNLVFTYKGELSDLSSIKKLTYEFASSKGEMTFIEVTDKQSFRMTYSNNIVTGKNVNLKISLDGKASIIEMKSVDWLGNIKK